MCEELKILTFPEHLQRWAAIRDINLSLDKCRDILSACEDTFDKWKLAIRRRNRYFPNSCWGGHSSIGDMLKFLVLPHGNGKPPFPRPEIPARRIFHPSGPQTVMYEIHTFPVDVSRCDDREPSPIYETAVRNREERIARLDCNELLL
jgi:hypothetical protein